MPTNPIPTPAGGPTLPGLGSKAHQTEGKSEAYNSIDEIRSKLGLLRDKVREIENLLDEVQKNLDDFE